MSDEVKPIYAKGIFNMNTLGETSQFTIFYYYDPSHYYLSLSREELRSELRKLKRNMQYFLDQEEIKINGKRVMAKVIFTRLSFLDSNHPFVEFLIRFKGKLRHGMNVYSDSYEEEIAEYPFEAIWVLPGKIIDYSISGKVKVNNNVLFLKVKKGTKISGEERIVFYLK